MYYKHNTTIHIAKCPSWTRNPIFRTAMHKLKHKIKRAEYDSIGEMLMTEYDLPITRDLAEIIDEIVYKFGDLKQPIFDRDGDGFSDKVEHPLSGGLRGYWWRGLDCNGRQEDVYPGRKPDNDDREEA